MEPSGIRVGLGLDSSLEPARFRIEVSGDKFLGLGLESFGISLVIWGIMVGVY